MNGGMARKHFPFFMVYLCALVFVIAFPCLAGANSIDPALEQEFSAAKASLENAISLRAEKFTPAFLQRARELIEMAADARQSEDSLLFSRATRLARTYAELARAAAELQTDIREFATSQGATDKNETEIETLKKVP
jgi:hypothetical protein